MLKRTGFIIPFILLLFAGCQQAPEKPGMHYEVLKAGPVIDSLAAHRTDYKADFSVWKTVYEQCIHDSLFPDAFFLGLQHNLGIGSISNQQVLNINKQIRVLDTSGNKDILDLISVHNSANCFSKINLNKSIQDSFYTELMRNLENAGDYSFLSGLVDTNQIVFTIGTLIDYSIRTDSLVSILQRTNDSSLLYFRQLLTSPGNVFFGRAAMIFGFDAQFQLKRKLTPEEAGKFKNEVTFNLGDQGDQGDKGTIQWLTDRCLKVVIRRNYSVFAQFYNFRKDE